MKLQILILLIATGVYSQETIEKDSIWFNGQKVSIEHLFYPENQGHSFSVISPEEEEKLYWCNEKEKLSKILGEYLEKPQKIIVGYVFVETIDEHTYTGQEVYYADKKQYAPVNNTKWIHNRFYDEADVIPYLKENSKRYYIEIDFDKIEPIYMDEEKTLKDFYEWLKKG